MITAARWPLVGHALDRIRLTDLPAILVFPNAHFDFEGGRNPRSHALHALQSLPRRTIILNMLRRTSPKKETVPPIMQPQQAIPLIRRQIERLEEVAKLHYNDPAVDAWESTTENILNAVYGLPDGELHRNTFEVKHARSGEPLFVNMSDAQTQREFVLRQEKRKALLEAYIEQFQILVPASAVAATLENEAVSKSIELGEAPDPLEAVTLICRRLHIVARQLRERRENRPTLEIKDEYDVQDLLHSLLRLHFDDIRPEEWTPSYGGGSARMDFLLKAEQTVIEAKMARPGRSAREVSEELIVDAARYREHPDCKTLVCLVYDPEGVIKNPRGVESDLARLSDPRLKVVAIITP